LSVDGYQRMVAGAGAAADFPFLVHSHMLRHSRGYNEAAVQGRRAPRNLYVNSCRVWQRALSQRALSRLKL
jgi:hypothetical protein